MNTSEFDQFADEYEQLHATNIAITGEKPEFFHEYKLKTLQQLVTQQGISATDILDFGSGVGNFGSVTAVDEESHGLPASARLRVPPLGALWLRYAD